MLNSYYLQVLSSGTEVQQKIILDPEYPRDYLAVSYDYDEIDL